VNSSTSASSSPATARAGPIRTEVTPADTGASSSRDVLAVSRFLCFFLLAFYLTMLLMFRGEDFLIRDPDIFWHVAVGQKIWQTGSVPWTDEYSHTFQGQPWIAKEWLSQLFLAGAYGLAGWRGIALLTAGMVALSHALLFLVLSRQMRLTVAMGVASLVYAFSMGHFGARPQIFVDPLIIIWVASLVQSVETKSSPSLLLLPLMILWANLHAGFTLGYVFAGILGAEALFASAPGARLRTGVRWASFIGIAVICGCITPYGIHSLLVTFQVAVGNEALSYITEWQPVTLQTMGLNELFLFGLLFLTMYSGAKVHFWRLMLVIILTYMMFAHIRFASLFAMLVPILMAGPLCAQFPFLRLTTQLEKDRKFFTFMLGVSRALSYPLYALIVCGTGIFALFGPRIVPAAMMMPTSAVDYMISNGLRDKVYNSYNFGGYLIFRGIKTFIDGRSDQLFQGGFIIHLYDIVDKHPREFISLLGEYKISTALVVPGSMESQELGRSPDWERVYFDKDSELYKKRS
jgi:hypothetical protein